jgi:hypothetical protein
VTEVVGVFDFHFVRRYMRMNKAGSVLDSVSPVSDTLRFSAAVVALVKTG